MRKFIELLSRTVQFSRPPKPKSKFETAVDLVFGKYLLTTNVVSSGVLMGLGDLMCQEIQIQGNKLEKRYDWIRIRNMFIVGCLSGPLNHYFYRWMDKVMPKADFVSAAKKIVLDQLLISPACYLLFFYSAGYLEKQTIQESTDEMKSKFITVYTVDWFFWPPVQFINFFYLAPQYRVFYVNGVTMVYNVFLSYIKHDDDLYIGEISKTTDEK